MKKTLILLAVGSFSIVSADPYGYTCKDGRCYLNQPQQYGNQPQQYGNQPQQYGQPTYHDHYYQNGQYYSQPQQSQGGYGQPQYQQFDGYQDSAQYHNAPQYDTQQYHGDAQYQNSPQTQYQNPAQFSQGMTQYQNQPQYSQGNSQYQDNSQYQQNPNYNNQPNDSSWNKNRPFLQSRSDTTTSENATVNDQDIAKEIHDALSPGWTSKGYPNVTFDVTNGNVILRGNVDTANDKTKVEDAVRKIKGVKQISNQIVAVGEKPVAYGNSTKTVEKNTYPQDYAASDADRQINAKIREKLKGGWFSKGYETLVIRTTNGIVTITGFVDKFDDIQKVNDEVKKVDGVKTVNNQLTVKNKK